MSEQICDFCESRLDEDEVLHPIYVNEKPKPKKIRVADGVDRVRGTEGDHANAALKALEECDDILLRKYDKVIDHSGVVKMQEAPDSGMSGFGDDAEYETRAAVEIFIAPKVTQEPLMEVCGVCKESFEAEGNS